MIPSCAFLESKHLKFNLLLSTTERGGPWIRGDQHSSMGGHSCPQEPSPSHTDPPSLSSVWKLFPSFQTSFRPLTYRPQCPLQATVKTTTFLLSLHVKTIICDSGIVFSCIVSFNEFLRCFNCSRSGSSRFSGSASSLTPPSVLVKQTFPYFHLPLEGAAFLGGRGWAPVHTIREGTDVGRRLQSCSDGWSYRVAKVTAVCIRLLQGPQRSLINPQAESRDVHNDTANV